MSKRFARVQVSLHFPCSGQSPVLQSFIQTLYVRARDNNRSPQAQVKSDKSCSTRASRTAQNGRCRWWWAAHLSAQLAVVSAKAHKDARSSLQFLKFQNRRRNGIICSPTPISATQRLRVRMALESESEALELGARSSSIAKGLPLLRLDRRRHRYKVGSTKSSCASYMDSYTDLSFMRVIIIISFLLSHRER